MKREDRRGQDSLPLSWLQFRAHQPACCFSHSCVFAWCVPSTLFCPLFVAEPSVDMRSCGLTCCQPPWIGDIPAAPLPEACPWSTELSPLRTPLLHAINQHGASCASFWHAELDPERRFNPVAIASSHRRLSAPGLEQAALVVGAPVRRMPASKPAAVCRSSRVDRKGPAAFSISRTSCSSHTICALPTRLCLDRSATRLRRRRSDNNVCCIHCNCGCKVVQESVQPVVVRQGSYLRQQTVRRGRSMVRS
jgi:hypothetical protein